LELLNAEAVDLTITGSTVFDLPFTHAGILSVTTGVTLQGGGNIAPTRSRPRLASSGTRSPIIVAGSLTFTVTAGATIVAGGTLQVDGVECAEDINQNGGLITGTGTLVATGTFTGDRFLDRHRTATVIAPGTPLQTTAEILVSFTTMVEGA
jgi:hypothetical protein